MIPGVVLLLVCVYSSEYKTSTRELGKCYEKVNVDEIFERLNVVHKKNEVNIFNFLRHQIRDRREQFSTSSLFTLPLMLPRAEQRKYIL